jgi:hypothetical protein
MLGSSNVQQYFASGNSHYVLPQTSLEWNYNLFYAPYVSINGSATPTLISGTWSNYPTTVASGRITSVFLANTSQTTRSCYSFNTTNGSGDSSITIPLSSTTNTYKVTFWAKLDTDAEVNLSALLYIDYHRAHSSSQKINSVSWTKFEIYLSPQPLGTAYSNPTLSLHHGATDGTTSYGVLIDQLEMYQTSDFEYLYGNLWTTSSPFQAFRPGESFVPSGNSLCQLPTNFRQINTNLGDSWNNQIMPVSPVSYHPTLIGTNSFNPVYKNGSLSEWSQYKYFVADSSSPTISGVYDQTLNVNKIVIKFNLAYSSPSSFTVNLAGKTNTFDGGYSSTYSYSQTYSGSDIDSSGTCILYYQSNGSWVSGLNGGTWTGTVDTTTMPGTPSFNFNGDIKFGGSKGGTTNATVAINSIQVTQNSSNISNSYSSSVNENLDGSTSRTSKSSEFLRMQVVEISPRLEIDVSYYTMSVNTQAELDNKQNPLPISAISANMATITLSNVPLTVSNKVLSLFSNNSSSSVLKGLFRNYVKCYVNYRIIDSISGTSPSDRVIHGGVFYVDTWDVSDIEKTVITAYDITKYLQLAQPTDYVAQTEDAFRLISNILDFAGFTDYDYDSLKIVTLSTTTLVNGSNIKSTAPIKIRYFYVDGTQQKVYDVLREIFEVYQIAAYIDVYGVMKFINVDGIFDKNNLTNMQLHDSSIPVSISTSNGYANNLTVYPNIVQDTYQESTKTKVGKINFTYKTPQIEKTIASDTRLLNNNLYVDAAPTFINKTNAIWDSTIDEATTYNTLATTMGLSDTYFTVPTYEATAASTDQPIFRSYGIDHDGYGIIENEIVSFKYKEISYVGPSINTTRSIANSAEFASKFAEISTLAGNLPFQVQATGRITNVDRGQFNTPVSSHTVMSTTYDIQQRFDISNASYTPTISTNGNILLSGNFGWASKITALDPYSINGSTNDYNTFSTKILINTTNADNSWVPMSYPDSSYGLVLHNSSQSESVFVMINQQTLNNVTKYYLDVRQDSAVGPTLLSYNNVNSLGLDITETISGQAQAYPPFSALETFGEYINLKFVKSTETTNIFEVYINKKKIFLSTKSNITLDTSGKFGIFASALLSSSSPVASIEFSEVYATQSALLTADYFYHYQLPWFAEKLSSNKKIFEINYMVQSRPSIIGINYYDIKDSQAPSLDAYPLKLSYDWYYYIDGAAPTTVPVNSPAAQLATNGKIKNVQVSSLANKNIGLPSIPVDKNSLTYSPIYHSGFRSRFAIINNSPCQIWLKKSSDSVNKINVDFSLITNSLITLGDDVVMEKVFDIANINETVDITTSWVQDENTASAILRSIYRALDGFTRDTTISIYGNPLYEIGDIVVINYGLKNIINQKYFVQGITQNFDTGLTTTLVLNQIG